MQKIRSGVLNCPVAWHWTTQYFQNQHWNEAGASRLPSPAPKISRQGLPMSGWGNQPQAYWRCGELRVEVICNLLAGEWRNRILLCRVDIEQPDEALEQAVSFVMLRPLSFLEVGKQVTLTAFHGKLSLLLAWTDAEALNVNVGMLPDLHFWAIDTSRQCHFVEGMIKWCWETSKKYGQSKKIDDSRCHSWTLSTNIPWKGSCLPGDIAQIPKQGCRGSTLLSHENTKWHLSGTVKTSCFELFERTSQRAL